MIGTKRLFFDRLRRDPREPTRPGKSINIEQNAPAVSFAAIGLFVATIGFSIGLDAGIFRDVASM
jgi:hypothetical protein